jgi:hypothetical protein
VKLCAFLNAISQKVINPESLPRLQNDGAQVLVSKIITHLLVHLVERFPFSVLYFCTICSPLSGSRESYRNMFITMLGQKEASPRAI